MHPEVSVIIPAYNVQHHILSTINSVLNQNYPKEKVEIIVINDGSTDNTSDVLFEANNLRVKIINKENGGVSSARNLGLSYAKGRFVSFLDGDDIWSPNFLREMTQYILENRYKLVGCLFNIETTNSTTSPPIKPPVGSGFDLWYFSTSGMTINTNSWLIEKNIIDDYDITFTDGCDFGEDTEFFSKVIIKAGTGKFGVLDQYLTTYRQRKGSLTAPGDTMSSLKKKMYFDAYKRTLEYMYTANVSDKIIISFKKRFYIVYINYLSSALIKNPRSEYIMLKNMFDRDVQDKTVVKARKIQLDFLVRSLAIKMDWLFFLLIKSGSHGVKFQ